MFSIINSLAITMEILGSMSAPASSCHSRWIVCAMDGVTKKLFLCAIPSRIPKYPFGRRTLHHL